MGAGPSHVPEVSKTKKEELKPEVSNADQEEPMKPVKVAKEPTEKQRKLPHKYEVIIKEADSLLSGSLDDHIKSGIFLNNKRKKYWIDEKTSNNCFMLFARSLLITWSENERYWKWFPLKESSDVEVEAASLLNVCWLEVHGRFDTSYLTEGSAYEVVFVVMVESGYGWATPVNLRLKLPNGSVQHHKECLLEKPKGQWIELKAGELLAERGQEGEMEFSLFEYEGGQWKRGLVIKGAIIRAM